MTERQEHWNRVYAQKASHEVSWYEREATTSMEAIRAFGLPTTAPIVDVGAGASTLADALVAEGFVDITLVDVAAASLAQTRQRLGPAGDALHYVTADVTTWVPPRTYALWHDRAVFHFLTEPADREAYRRVLARAVPPGGLAVIATFADDGPERCSGLAVRRYSPESLAEELASVLRLLDSRRETHVTPGGAEQRFVFGRFERVGGSP